MSNTKVRTSTGEDIHAGTTWEARISDGALIVKSKLTGDPVAHYPKGAWASVQGVPVDAAQPEAEPIKVGDKVKSGSSRGGLPGTVIHIHEGVAWVRYGLLRDGVASLVSLTKVEA